MRVLNTRAVSSEVHALVGLEENVYPGREGITTSYLSRPHPQNTHQISQDLGRIEREGMGRGSGTDACCPSS